MSNEKLEFFLLGLLIGGLGGAVLITLFDSLAQVLFGWPFILLAIVAMVAGIVWNKAAWVLVGALLSIPFSFYLAATPRFRLVGILLPLFNLAAAYALRRDRRWLAGLLILPFIAVAIWIGWTVINQP